MSAEASRQSRVWAPVILLMAAIATISIAIRLVLRLPGVPYNIAELFLDDASVPVLVIFSLALLWIGGGAMILARWLVHSPRPYLVLPLGALLLAMVSRTLLKYSVTYESLDDILGASSLFQNVTIDKIWGEFWSHAFLTADVPGLVAFLERRIRYLALYSLVSLTLALALVPVVMAKRHKISASWQLWALGVSAMVCLWLSKMVVIDGASTDNLTELIAKRSLFGLDGTPFLYLIVVLMAANVAVLMLARTWLGRIIALAVSVISIPAGWWLLNTGLEQHVEKYYLVFSGTQFLLGPDREHALSALTLFLRWTAVQIGGVGVMFMGAWIADRLLPQTVSWPSQAHPVSLSRGGGRSVLAKGLLVSVALVAVLAAADLLVDRAAPKSLADQMGTRFTEAPADLRAAPKITEIQIPSSIPGDAIWGATGRDASGHIWIGVSTAGKDGSAHLLELDPETKILFDRGNVIAELKNAGIYRAGEGQIKIHTKIVEAEDGYLYFGSFDDEGVSDDGTTLPKWGGHLWRMKPDGVHWEHLYSTPEGLVAIAGNGRWIYALGFWGHVLYQYDTRARTWHAIRVGSIPNHVSRNIVVDRNGHAYVPRVREWQPGEAAAHRQEKVSVELVEFDPDLKEVVSTPLSHYDDTELGRYGHGLIGLSYLQDGSIVVTTHAGYLYRVTPSDAGAASIAPIGWIHPAGQSYASSLFPVDGERYLAGVTTRAGKFEWFTYDLLTHQAQVQDLHLTEPDALIYGSSTRDDKGRFYVVGNQKAKPHGYRPLLLQIELPTGSPS